MQNTVNLNLKKPDQNDFVNIGDINDNMDILDAEVAKKYVKPLAGIPSLDLDSATQAALKKAETALQSVTKASVGLGNVDNTSDVNKPVSTAQQVALDKKANLASPILTGTPTAPTAAESTNTQQIATTAFVDRAVKTHQADLASQASGKGASLIGINDSGNLLTATTVEGALAEVMAKANSAFQSASDGKVLIANAITGKGQIASGSDTFVQLATAIGNIKVGKEKANGTITSASGQVYIPGTTGGAGNSYYVSFDMSVLGFVPSILIFTFASKTNTTVGSIWWKENYYVNGSYYANAQCNGAGFRVPYSSAVLQIPISNQNTAFDWVAYSI